MIGDVEIRTLSHLHRSVILTGYGNDPDRRSQQNEEKNASGDVCLPGGNRPKNLTGIFGKTDHQVRGRWCHVWELGWPRRSGFFAALTTQPGTRGIPRWPDLGGPESLPH